MQYKTIEFRIRFQKPSIDNIIEVFNDISLDQQYEEAMLGKHRSYVEHNGTRLVEIDCPFSQKAEKAFIFSEKYSNDDKKRILSVKCIHCNNQFHIYQEAYDDDKKS